MSQSDNHMIGRAGKYSVAAELNRRGAYATPFPENMPGIDLVANDKDRERIAYIKVKTSNGSGRWHLDLKDGWDDIILASCPGDGQCDATCTPRLQEPITGKEDHFWIFVTLHDASPAQYYVVEDWRARKILRDHHEAYLQKNGGQRPGENHDSPHVLLTEKDFANCQGNWKALGLQLHSN